MNEFTCKQYETAMDKYGRDSGSSIPCRLVEDAAECRLSDATEVPDIYPGNRLSPESHDGAFKEWSYTTELNQGSYTIVHTGYNNPYVGDDKAELAELKKQVAALEAKIASK